VTIFAGFSLRLRTRGITCSVNRHIPVSKGWNCSMNVSMPGSVHSWMRAATVSWLPTSPAAGRAGLASHVEGGAGHVGRAQLVVLDAEVPALEGNPFPVERFPDDRDPFAAVGVAFVVLGENRPPPIRPICSACLARTTGARGRA
jgi:hypothetical protein